MAKEGVSLKFVERSSGCLSGTIRIRGNLYSKRGIAALIGGCLMLISFSIDFSYANLNTYVISYLRHEVTPSTDYADWIFVSTSKTLVQGLVMPFAGLLSNRIGLRLSLTIGSILYSVGYLCTGWAITHSLPLVIVTMAVMHGLGFALVYSQTVGAVMAWSPSNPGTFGGICIAGYGFGSMIWNPLETGFVNPLNRDPVVGTNGTDAYFEDPDVLARIPKLFYLLGGTFIVMQIVSIILLRVPTEEELAEMQPILDNKDDKDGDQENANEGTFSLKPMQVLKTSEFYKMWVSFLAMNMINMFINNYQKSFGQLFIKDDSFFAIIATLSSVANGVTRMIWGYTYDKQGFQFCMMIISSVSTALAFSFVDLAAIDYDSLGSRIFYGVWICALYSMFPGMYATFAPSTRDTFGPQFFEANFGLIFTQNIVNSLMMIGATQGLFRIVGYNGMFFLTGGIGVIGMLASWLMPSRMTSENFRSRFEVKPSFY
ncbi:hypothetical protein TCAL_07649 [Tigriopus californicus]|uniref:Major facilitator superfamily (MFS) profile domain-containing protein n=1 Tax=Tigriopus californicus TaxID=6832 RepID=A0A553NPZ7_TIGCA|nr:oxalate:formate antiporter-like [Tigriopus californicus]TRY67487.1 hypothetical protein TCAL_07649 [Tigriopus californicus]|eukprot:TCALIF_07649-PA protein Name:"Similar to oxlT Oxalate:formate antiporter (Oxalobacter formigenes)" AED:0.03 eAED:0.03 QI:52/1/1/1/0.5/0.42/7/65/485